MKQPKRSREDQTKPYDTELAESFGQEWYESHGQGD